MSDASASVGLRPAINVRSAARRAGGVAQGAAPARAADRTALGEVFGEQDAMQSSRLELLIRGLQDENARLEQAVLSLARTVERLMGPASVPGSQTAVKQASGPPSLLEALEEALSTHSDLTTTLDALLSHLASAAG